MPATPSTKFGLVRPADADFINTWPGSARAMIDAVDALMSVVDQTDPRPAAGVFGRIHRHPVTGVISFDAGSGWIELSRSPHGSRHGEGGDDPIPALAPIGVVLAYTGSALPAGGSYAWADGGLINSDTYSVYRDRTGHAYNGGVSPGSGTPTQGTGGVGPLIRLPDKRGRVSIGGNNYGAGAAGAANTRAAANRGTGGGERDHQLTVTELAAHGHSTAAHSHSGSTGAADRSLDHLHAGPGGTFGFWSNFVGGPYGVGAGSGTGLVTVTGATDRGIDHTHPFGTSNASPAAQSSGSDFPHNNLPPYEADHYIVRIA